MPVAECPFKLTRGCWIGCAESKKIRENILSDKLLVFLFSLGAISHDLITKASLSCFSLPERSSQNYCSSLDCFSEAPKSSRGLSPHFPRQDWVCGAYLAPFRRRILLQHSPHIRTFFKASLEANDFDVGNIFLLERDEFQSKHDCMENLHKYEYVSGERDELHESDFQ